MAAEKHDRSVQVGVLRAGLGVLNRAAPGLAAACAERLFFTPRRRPLSSRVREVLATGRRFDVSVRSHRVAAWTWGAGPAVYLVHGWEGVGGQLGDFVEPLLDRGLRVVTFDAPGHGASNGRRSSLVDFAAALDAVVAVAGAPHAVVAHSLGAAATAFAMSRGTPVGRAVFLGPTAGPRDWTEKFAAWLGLAPAVVAGMKARAERRLGVAWDELDVPALAGTLATPLLVLHDRDDREVPWGEGAAIARAWPGARLRTTVGLGHRGILRDRRVIARAVAFATGEPDTGDDTIGACGTPGCERRVAPGEAACESCGLEHALFFRERRAPAA